MESPIYATKIEAKKELCRNSLKKLKSDKKVSEFSNYEGS